MKKNNLFKIVGIVILFYCLLTWILPTATSFGVLDGATRNQIGVFYLAQVPFEAIGGFSNLFIFILLVGGFYGVLEASGVYKRLLNLFAKKFKGKEKIFLIALICLIAIISSISGLETGLFFIFPLLISILLVMGFDKLVALSATFGSTIVGMFGSTLSNTFYSVGNQNFSLKMTDGILGKIVLLVLGVGLLIFFTLDRVKKIKGQEKSTITKELEAELSEIKDDESKNKKPLWPLILIVDITLLILIIGTIGWEAIFGSNWFNTAHEWLMNLKIGEFAIFSKLFGSVPALGTWSGPLRYQYYSIFVILSIVILSIVYRIKPKECFEAFIGGIKKYIVPALLAILACSIFVFVFYFPVFNTIGTWIMQLSETFNIALTGLFTLLGSVFYTDFYYFSYYTLPYIGRVAGDANFYQLTNIMFVSLYSLAMLIAPTSVLMLLSLSTTGVSYKDWIKHIWKLFLSLLVVAFIVFSILLLI